MSLAWRFWLFVGLLAWATTAAAQSNPPAEAPSRVAIPTVAHDGAVSAEGSSSPVAFFRKLLDAAPNDRTKLLASRNLAARNRILEKVSEYEALAPEERELRLEATELSYYLVPLMRMPPSTRAAEMSKIPDNLQPLIKSRLLLWDILPPPLQSEFLTNETTLLYFAQASRAATTNAQSQKFVNLFKTIFEIKPEEKQQVLNFLSESERVQMEKTLKAFDNLPADQRRLCERNYARFAGMSDTERADFLKNAQSWSAMSPEERQAWRDLVTRAPIMPPMPPIEIMPPGLAPNGMKIQGRTN